MLSFGHLIPHILQESSAVSGYGILYYVVAGFLAMLFVEKVAFGHDDHDHDCSSHSSTSIKPEFNPSTPKASLCGLKQKLSGSQTVVKTESSPTVAVRRPWFKVNSAQILCFAMGIHSFFESAALGISDSKTTAVLMAASIALHQPAESLALVIAFLKHCNTSDNSKANHHNKMSKRSIILWLLGFSSIALFGNLAGSLIRRVASEEVESIVMALTAGTFIYVGASEVSIFLLTMSTKLSQ